MLRDDHVRDLSSAPSAADPRSPRLRRAGAKAVLYGPAAPAALPFEVVESKIRIPPLLAGTVSRTALVNRLRAAGAFPLVLVVAPAGYGKTTLLSQWATRDARPFAWVSIDEHDNDPVAFLRHVAAALDQVESVPASALEPLREDEKSAPTRALPRLAKAIAARRVPFVLVLDGADLLTRESTAAVAELVKHIPAGSMIVLSGRVLRNYRWPLFAWVARCSRSAPYELALSRREAEILLRAAGVELKEEEIAELFERTEGWPAGLYLAALASTTTAVPRTASPRKPSRSPGTTATSPTTSAPSTSPARAGAPDVPSPHVGARDDVRPALRCRPGAEGIGSRTGGVEAANLFVVPLDRHRGSYRYHHLFRDLLQRELEEPSLSSSGAQPARSRLVRSPGRRRVDAHFSHGPETRTAPPESSARSP